MDQHDLNDVEWAIMHFIDEPTSRSQSIIDLISTVFAESEGDDEGQLIGQLAADLLATTSENERYFAVALDEETVVGAVIFTRLIYPEDERTVFLLAPAAIATAQQGKGLGQQLIRHGLAVLRDRRVDVAITYGDVNFYGKVGFVQITEDIAKAPLPLQYPHGWLGQSLTDQPLLPLKGPSFCVDVLNKSAYW